MKMTRKQIQECDTVSIRVEGFPCTLYYEANYRHGMPGKKVFFNGIKYPRRHSKYYKTLDNLKALRLALKELGNPMMCKGKVVSLEEQV